MILLYPVKRTMVSLQSSKKRVKPAQRLRWDFKDRLERLVVGTLGDFRPGARHFLQHFGLMVD